MKVYNIAVSDKKGGELEVNIEWSINRASVVAECVAWQNTWPDAGARVVEKEVVDAEWIRAKLTGSARDARQS